jgi:exodeoxyribonuclease V alpha subunit
MTNLLYSLARNGDIHWLSYYFAEFIAKQARIPNDELASLSAALVSEANLAGNVCIDLDAYSMRPLFSSSRIDAAEIPVGLDCADWCDRLHTCPCIGRPYESAPLILDENRLYLNRLWFYEDFVAGKIRAMLEQEATINESEIAAQVDKLFTASDEVDQDQKDAVQTAASKPFSVISGGPGSGKTSTIVRILAVLLALNPECRIALAAPTGKAAARMMVSIRQRVDQIGLGNSTKITMPGEATTIHRLLGYRRNGFNYNELHRLPFDCVVIDEASMIDLKLMFHLLAALPDHAQLILLGDRDQLASVAAGNVLGDITGHGQALDIGPAAVAASIALLRNSYRFNRDSAISEIAFLVNQGRSAAATDLLRSNDRGLHWYAEESDQIHADTLTWIYNAYQPVFESDTPADALEIYETTRVLCATNQGYFGVESLNHRISSALLARNKLPETNLYSGLPIMITRNHHELDLFNGDTGILWQYEDGLRACFRDSDGGIRDLAINRLPKFTPAWASTVHKSQGSEFDSVLLILPSDPESGVLSRELLYTAITRARQRFILHAASNVVIRAIENLTQRHSGLAYKLGWPG